MSEQMKFHVQELRPEVMAFALLMEQRLREKDADKGTSWKSMTQEQLFPAFMSKALAIESALFFTNNPNRDHVDPARHAIDLANYCMMIADMSGALTCG